MFDARQAENEVISIRNNPEHGTLPRLSDTSVFFQKENPTLTQVLAY